jgi:hypothetical protein
MHLLHGRIVDAGYCAIAALAYLGIKTARQETQFKQRTEIQKSGFPERKQRVQVPSSSLWHL